MSHVSVPPAGKRYTRLADAAERTRYDYAAPGLDYTAVLVYDEFGLVLDYPGLAIRVA